MTPQHATALFLIALGIGLLNAPRFIDSVTGDYAKAAVYGVSAVGGLSCIIIGIKRLVEANKGQ